MCLRLLAWDFVATGLWVLVGLVSQIRTQAQEFAMHNYDDGGQRRTGFAETLNATWPNPCKAPVTGMAGPVEEIAILPETIQGSFSRSIPVSNVALLCYSRINLTNAQTGHTTAATFAGICLYCNSTRVMLSPAAITKLWKGLLGVGETFEVSWTIDVMPAPILAKYHPESDASLARISALAANTDEATLGQQTRALAVKYLQKHSLRMLDKCNYEIEAIRLLIRKLDYKLMPPNAGANVVEILTLRYKLELETAFSEDFCNHFQNLRCHWSGQCVCAVPLYPTTGQDCLHDLRDENRSCILNPQNEFSQKYDLDVMQPSNECFTDYICQLVEYGTECEEGYTRQQQLISDIPASLFNSILRFPLSEKKDGAECVCMIPRMLPVAKGDVQELLVRFSRRNTLEIDSVCDFAVETVKMRHANRLNRLDPQLDRSIFLASHYDDMGREVTARVHFEQGLAMVLLANGSICKTYKRLTCLPTGRCGCYSNASQHVELIRQKDGGCVLTRGSICGPAYWRGRFESYIDTSQEDADPPVCVQGLSCVDMQTGKLCPRNASSTPIVSFKYKVFPYLHNQFKKEPIIGQLQGRDYCRCSEEFELSTSTGQNVWIFIAPLAVLTILVSLVAVWKHLQATKKDFLLKLTEAERQAWEYGNQTSEHDKAPEGCIVLPQIEGSVQALALPYDKGLEISARYIVYGEDKGSGCFGIVRRGRLTRNGLQQDVAIKTCQNASNLLSIMAEIKILSFIAAHENVIRMIGAVTRNVDAPELILEYCDRGNILQVLQMYSGMFLDQIVDDCFDFGFRGRPGRYDKIWAISTTNLLSWSWQVANGMQYLSVVKKIIHGDLFARNVLVTGNGVAKITDFGLSRKFGYDGKPYIRTKEGCFPLPNLLPPEARNETERVLSSQMDVWTFGILLWELFTIGAEPDCVHSAEELQKPVYATSGIYSIMMECWNENPAERPEFGHLRCTIQSILGEGYNPDATFEFGINFVPQREM